MKIPNIDWLSELNTGHRLYKETILAWIGMLIDENATRLEGFSIKGTEHELNIKGEFNKELGIVFTFRDENE